MNYGHGRQAAIYGQAQTPNPWASGAPPLPHQQQPQAYGSQYTQSPGYGYGQPQNFSMGSPAYPPPIQQTPPHPGYGRQMMSNQRVMGRGGQHYAPKRAMQRQTGGTPNKRPNNGPNKLQQPQPQQQQANNQQNNKGKQNGNWQNKNNNNNQQQQNNQKTVKNRNNFNRNRQGKKANDNMKSQARKNAEALPTEELPIKQGNEQIKNIHSKGIADLEASQLRYVCNVFGFACKLCEIFIKDKAALLEHVKSEDHVSKFDGAEKERLEKEAAEKAEKEKEEKETAEATTTEETTAEETTEATAEEATDETTEETADEATNHS